MFAYCLNHISFIVFNLDASFEMSIECNKNEIGDRMMKGEGKGILSNMTLYCTLKMFSHFATQIYRLSLLQ